MSFFFKNHPIISYNFRNEPNNPVLVNDITRRLRLSTLLQNKAAIYFRYDIKDGERPDIIAEKYYDDNTLDWVILLTNEIHDPYFQWPLDNNSLNKFVAQKYGSVSAAQSINHHYEKIIQQRTVTDTGEMVRQKSLIVDYTTYVATNPSLRRAVDSYTYEVELNEKRRSILILDKLYIGLVKESHRKLLNEWSEYGKGGSITPFY